MKIKSKKNIKKNRKHSRKNVRKNKRSRKNVMRGGVLSPYVIDLISRLTSNESEIMMMGGNNIGDEGAREVATALNKNTKLIRLHINYNNIGDKGAQAIATALEQNTTLTILDISRNNIGVDGAQAIATALKINKTLTTLNISENRIDNAGAEALAEALKVNKTLTTLDISFNQIDDVGETAITEALQRNRHLFVDQYIKIPESQMVYEPLMDCNKIDKSTIMYIICELKKLFPNEDNSEFLNKEFIKKYVAVDLLMKNENTQKKLVNKQKIPHKIVKTIQMEKYKNIIKPEYYPWRI